MRTFDDLVKEYLPLNEGLIVSYDVQKLKTKIYEVFGDKIQEVEIIPINLKPRDGKYGNALTIAVVFKQSILGEEREKLEKILNVFGYYISIADDKSKSFQIEPRYSVEFVPREWNIDALLHITPKKNISKIMKKGLLPKQSQTKFDHPPDRIYMFLPSSMDTLGVWMKILADSKKIDLNDMGVLKIKVKPYQKYYLDDTATLENELLAVYTTSAIPRTDIEVLLG